MPLLSSAIARRPFIASYIGGGCSAVTHIRISSRRFYLGVAFGDARSPKPHHRTATTTKALKRHKIKAALGESRPKMAKKPAIRDGGLFQAIQKLALLRHRRGGRRRRKYGRRTAIAALVRNHNGDAGKDERRTACD